MSKPIHISRAAEGVLLSALIVACGVTGALDIFKNERGFSNVMSVGADWASAVKGLGEDCTITWKTMRKSWRLRSLARRGRCGERVV